jgi:hypothetical protein
MIEVLNLSILSVLILEVICLVCLERNLLGLYAYGYLITDIATSSLYSLWLDCWSNVGASCPCSSFAILSHFLSN